MINLTVKTLDSQNHIFSVEEEITISQFKEKIADTVNIPAETQRLIYCGRVLQDSTLLKDYDVDGKVIHLVQRPPPSATGRPDGPEPPPQTHPRVRGGVGYMGTMRMPVGGFENTIHSLPMHSLSNSRLNVARRMITRAENILNILENPNRQEGPVQNEPQEEATPVFEARVVIPSSTTFGASEETFPNNAPIAVDAEVAPQDLLNSEDIEAIIDPLTNNSNNIDQLHSVSSTPEVISPLTGSTENLDIVDSESRSAPEQQTSLASEETAASNDTPSNSSTSNQSSSAGNVSRTSEFAEILDSLNRMHTRFTPHMEQYHNFLRDDPVVPQENVRSTQAMLNHISEVCHYLGHAYHSVSDIILRVRTPPPRQLLCRPMLIQHAAIVQVDIPIQVEAQIDVPTNRNPPSTTSTTTATAAVSGVTPTATVAPSASDTPLNTILGFPFMPRSGVRVETYRLPVMNGNHWFRHNNNRFQRGLNTTGVDAHAARTRPVGATSAETDTDGPDNTTNVSSANTTGGTDNPNMEFFMEVTPESISIDSLETAFVGSNQGNDLNAILQESINPPPPEFIQSIMQMAGQFINRSNFSNVSVSTTSTAAATAPIGTPPNATSATASDTSVTTAVGAARTTPFQNSQARGNTQTQPTTATHTRSTPRPHVHLAQHTMHAFDPFLPCNSHHVTPRRRSRNNNNAASQQSSGSQNPTSNLNQGTNTNAGNESSPVYNILQNILNSVRNTYSNSLPPSYARRPPSASASNESNSTRDLMNAATMWMSSVAEGNYVDHRPTISRILQQFPDNNYVPGASIFTDLVMLLSRGFTLGDIAQITNGRLEPLANIEEDLRAFVLSRVLDGDTSQPGYERGVEKLIAEMHLFINHLANLETRDNIDVVRSVQALFRARLATIISLAISLKANSTRLMYDQIKTTVQQLGAILVRASQNGADAVQTLVESFLIRCMEGVPHDIQQWSIQTTRPQIREFFNDLDVPESLLQRYIVRVVDPISDVTMEHPTQNSETELMQVEELVQSSGVAVQEVPPPSLQMAEDSEALPTVVLGSAPWHAQVPSDWVPIIVRDSQRQRRQSTQAPFSDAYLSGMPSKRRKLADCKKPPTSISQVISESVRRAVTAAGFASATPIETVTQAAATDVNLQSAYRDLLHNSVQSELENNEDFTPEQFPNVNSYFNNRRQ